MSQTLTLYRLQQADSQSDKANGRLQEIIKILEDDADIQGARRNAEAASMEYDSSSKALSEAETAVNQQRIKINQTESSLYSGATRNPKELQDLQNELSALKRYLVVLEDRQIDAMQSQENCEETRNKTQEILSSLTVQTLQKNQSLVGERDRLGKELERIGAERKAIAEALPSVLLQRYETLRSQHRGIAITVIDENSCSACGSNLTPALVQLTRMASEITSCPTCGRILYGG